LVKAARHPKRRTRMQDRLQLNLILEDLPPVNLTEEERRELVAALATLLLLAVRAVADE